MKKLCTNTALTCSRLLLLAMCTTLWQVASAAGPVAMVNAMIGNAFISDGTGTKVIESGDHLYRGAEVLVEDGSQITFSNYHDQKFHLAGPSHIKIRGRKINLLNGELWYQVLGKGRRSIIKTANANVQFSSGEGIVSFDTYGGKTQLFVIKGRSRLSHSVDRRLSTYVPTGKFSFISDKERGGKPRIPTRIGENSYKSFTGHFIDIKELDGTRIIPKKAPKKYVRKVSRKRKMYARRIASLYLPGSKSNPFEKSFRARMAARSIGSKMASRRKKKRRDKVLRKVNQARLSTVKPKKIILGKIPLKIYGVEGMSQEKLQRKKISQRSESIGRKRSITRMPSSLKPRVVYVKCASKPKKNIKARVAKASSVAGRVKIRTIGQKKRIPASIVPAKVHTPKPKTKIFERGLDKEYKKQMPHSKDFNRLIQSLKSINMDYHKGY